MVLDSIFDLKSTVPEDESKEKINYSEHHPQNGTLLNPPGNYQIIIENQDAYFLPSKSYLRVEGKLTKENGRELINNEDLSTLVNNAVMFLFQRIEYQINDKIIEYVNEPGYATLMKGLLSYPYQYAITGGNCGWSLDEFEDYTLEDTVENNVGFRNRYSVHNVNNDRNINFIIPLKHIFGFCEDYRKVVYGVRHSLHFIKKGDKNALVKYQGSNPKFVLNSLVWVMPKVLPSLRANIYLKELMFKKEKFDVDYRVKVMQSKNVDEDKLDFTWNLGASPQFRKPRFIIIGFQTGAYENYENAAVFDHCNVRSVHATLNSERYPNINILNDFSNGKYAENFYLAREFRQTYYNLGEENNEFMISSLGYKNLYPLFVIDTTKQSEQLKSSITDITIYAEFSAPVEPETKCFCLILADEHFKLSSEGNKMVIL